jgi:hypothetical protein
MKRLALVVVLLLVGLLGPGGAARGAGQATPSASPASASPASAPVEVGDWTFQVIDVERLDSYYAEHFGEVYEPEGVFLIVGVAITYNGTSTNELDRYTGGFFRVTTASGDAYDQSSDVFSQFGIEQSYVTEDYPYPPVPTGGVAEPGVTHYQRLIFDVPADATGLALASGPLLPETFSIPLPDPADIATEAQWELEVLDAKLYETLGPPLTGSNQYDAEGVYLVVDVRLTRLLDEWAAINASWFALRTEDGRTIPIAGDETLELGVPIDSEGREQSEFSLVFDVPPGTTEATLVTNPGAPLSVDIPLKPTAATLPTPTPTATLAPTATSAPTATPSPTPRPTATPSPTPQPTATPSPTPRPTATPSPTPRPTVAPTVSTEPGAIRVVTAGGDAAPPPSAGGAVEVILDTSGSMLQPMGDSLRIDVAKDVLTGVVTGQLPAGTQTAIRVFGTVPGSCDTTLAVPLGPLDPNSAASTVGAIQAIDEVRTPLGASLEAAGTDLRGVEGPKLIVLITDGEETCGGDPGAAISALVAQGVDIRVNIVGFAIDDPAIEQTLAAWAEQGGGQYFAATDADELGPALTQALQPTFEVEDSDGFTVGSGIVNGEAVPVPAGRYTVVVNTSPPTRIERVEVPPGETTEVTPAEGGG